MEKFLDFRHHDPFAVLGRHIEGKDAVVRTFIPCCQALTLVENGEAMTRKEGTDLFEWRGPAAGLPKRYRLRWTDDQGHAHEQYDTYCFPPQLGDLDMHLFAEGRHLHAYRFLGAHEHQADGVDGVLFAVWAPNAERVSVIGDFNRWDGRTHCMRVRGDSGIWELFIPGLGAGVLYKFEIRTKEGFLRVKADPYANAFQMRPETACWVNRSDYRWDDEAWMNRRAWQDWQHTPMSVYEVHLGSWQRDDQGHFLNYRELAHRLAEYVNWLGFTHIELLPITEHPFDGSWGYQSTGYFAPTSRFGSPDDFRYFVDHLHQRGIGIILDWVPAHFPKDDFALAKFDGTALYEHEDPRLGEHRDWGTLIYNYGRNEVRNFLLSSAVYWLEEFHLDGLRVDAVASMLYLDYSREANDWIPNEYGGRENLRAVDFIRHLNEEVHRHFPGALVMAEESTAWPQVSRPTWLGGLGFSMKWNMGWMHDSLTYFHENPVHRSYHHDQLTFGLLYCFTENFVLPFSHDEVVHGKGSLISKMPGDAWQQFANLRLLYTYMFSYPGKKLLFMGSEFGQGREWNAAEALDWHQNQDPQHRGVQLLVGDLARLYREQPALHELDFSHEGFSWIDCHDSTQSVISYLRRDRQGRTLVIVLNFTPVPRYGYRIGVPRAGSYRELINSDSAYYNGSNLGNEGLQTESVPWMGFDQSLNLILPPLAGLVLAAN
ncbi:MAG: 1,4-alpha-glucan branching protein GlgB [Gammaproteobacteria bacterium]|nr:1,4-alpha-glucan branching protein GlgB [Gammaproteobacteria bacterium]MBU1654600.1 1,4-alpha-glucan branching protein GlgB [Gammaproteobacteria bacterium]MBU1962328.1 1,4-alpha-glucan branching protein GlgB [Gammaproteobacteria bacterium]